MREAEAAMAVQSYIVQPACLSDPASLQVVDNRQQTMTGSLTAPSNSNGLHEPVKR